MRLFSFSFLAMATPCRLHLYAESDVLAELVARESIDEVRRIESRYSRYRPDSELSRINAIAKIGGQTEVDSETAGLLNFAFAAYQKSDGLFDITSGLLRRAWDFDSAHIPSLGALQALLDRIGLNYVIWEEPLISFSRSSLELDFGGIGKEYAADRVVDVARSGGIRHGLVDLGGDITVIGPHPDGAPWQVAIRHPRQIGASLGIVQLSSGAIATSGDYERFMEVGGRRYCHILNPRTGMPCAGLMAVSVTGDTCLMAGAITTIAMLKGLDGPDWLAYHSLPHVYVDETGVRGGTLEIRAA